ncbi:TRAP transporter small permease subunit [Parvularcula maris]|uniref:TRAP transporter small permease protein n=1 Tax=Parvularcula maris TaxID=2965077 RepID=A0A9X2L7U5_9PROT|nr:TRAP transporter small permease subunit [Parvularcula maris]MCQ8184588.1 TRAP transporter small permease subunit [Parvularcula maris]
MTAKLLVIALLLLPLFAAPFSAAVREALRRIVGAGFWIAGACVLPLLVVQLGVVLLRSVFSVSFIWLQESTLYLFGAMFLLSSGALLLRDGHVRVDIFYGKAGEKRQALVDLVGMLIFVLPLSVLIIWVSWRYVGTSWTQLERSQETSGLHIVYILKSLIPAFAVMLLFAGELRAAELLNKLRGRG